MAFRGFENISTHRIIPEERGDKRSLHRCIAPFNLAIVYLGLGDRERALMGLEQAYAAHSRSLALLKMDKMFDPLHLEPRFIVLLKKLNFEK